MLMAIRDKVSGVLAWIVVFILVAAFALFGLDYYLKSETRVYAAKINETEIPTRDLQRAVQFQRQQLRQQLGDDYKASDIDEALLRDAALRKLVNQEVIAQAAEAAGFSVSDAVLAAEIQATRAFQQNGVFNAETYRQVLGYQGMTPQMFEYTTRRSLLVQQYLGSIDASLAVTSHDMSRLARLNGQQRKVDYLRLPASEYADKVTISADEVTAYYEDNRARFVTPEQVRLQYVELTGEQLAQTVTVTEDMIRQFYQGEGERFGRPEERRASHILIGFGEDPQSAFDRAQDLLERLNNGEDFATLAQQESEDPGSAAQGGDLGFNPRGIMVPEFDEALFGLKQVGQLSEVVSSEFGYHIIRLTEIRAADIRPLEEVRDEVVAELRRVEVENIFYDHLERLTELAYEAGDTLQPVADQMGLKLQETAWISRDGGEGISAEPLVYNAAFSEDVLELGHNSEPLELDNEHVVVVRVLEHRASSQKSFESTEADIRALLHEQRSRELARQEGVALLEKLAAGESLDSLAAGLGKSLSESRLVGRADENMPPAIVNKAFAMPHPEAAPSVAGVGLDAGDYALVRVLEVKDGDLSMLSEADKLGLRRTLKQIYSGIEQRALVDYLRGQMEIDIPVEDDAS